MSILPIIKQKLWYLLLYVYTPSRESMEKRYMKKHKGQLDYMDKTYLEKKYGAIK